jgi:hypothetical protein
MKLQISRTVIHSPSWPNGEPQPVRTAADIPKGFPMITTYRPGGDSDAQSDKDGWHGQGC